MGRALFDRAAGGAHEARSAGSNPADRVHPEVITAMDELGLDLRGAAPTLLTHEMAEWANVVVTMGCGDACPFIPGKRYVDWDLEDPEGRSLDAVRAIRDEIARRIDDLVADLAAAKPDGELTPPI
jgi:arsenate reductase